MPFKKTTNLPVLTDPPCRFLLSKGIFMFGKVTPDSPVGDGNCWCAKTQHVIGPDDAMVARAKCDSSRSCYIASL